MRDFHEVRRRGCGPLLRGGAKAALLVTTLLVCACRGVGRNGDPLPAPRVDETLAIASLRTFALHGAEPRCALLRDDAEWARFCTALGPAAQPLPTQPCSFEAFSAVVVVLPMEMELARIEAATSTEEGVDVLTITRTFDDAPAREQVARAYLSQTALVVLPQRPRQLAVVLKTLRGAKIDEETLEVFAGGR